MELERCFHTSDYNSDCDSVVSENSFKGNNNILKQLVFSGRIVYSCLACLHSFINSMVEKGHNRVFA